MKYRYISIIILVISVVGCHSDRLKSESGKSQVNMRKNLRWIPVGNVKPLGWMRDQMQYDLKKGFVGYLDEIVPDLIVEDDIYGKDRLTSKVKAKNVGAVTKDDDWEIQYLWWNSETQSNWWDGMIRYAFMLGDEKSKKRVRKYVDHILSTQDSDGYIGIYARDLRYKHITENGELWAQATLFRSLLGYYEATSDKKVLSAVKRAVSRTMQAYPLNNSEPFNIFKPYAGAGHGLMFTDILYQLYLITNRSEYLNYAFFLYKDYNSHSMEEEDIMLKNLLDPDYHFAGHGVHTYEHMRPLALAAYFSDEPKYKNALDGYIQKLTRVISHSGGPVGDEWIFGRVASADSIGYDYCNLQEMLDSYNLMLLLSGDAKWADAIEKLLFNAAQGARHPNESSIAMNKSDNSYEMAGGGNAGNEQEERLEQSCFFKGNPRYKYSPSHQDVAVCCPPNASRIYPYYLKAMWMHSDAGLSLNLFGPSELNTRIKGEPVKIIQLTDYPFDLKVDLVIEKAPGDKFEIAIRKPRWTINMVVNSPAVVSEDEDYICLSKLWLPGDRIHISFETQPKFNTDHDGHKYLSYGPLVFALPLKGTATEIKKYSFPGFRDLIYRYADSKSKKTYQFINEPFSVKRNSPDHRHPWETAVFLTGKMYDQENKTVREVELRPMGGTILRKITFPMR